MNKQKTIAEIVAELTPAEAKKQATELADFLDDENSSTSAKDWIWLELLEKRAEAKQ